jgi:polyisoprenoid-binding protein YceI
MKDPWGNVRAGVSASAKINRKDFGVAWNALTETGGVVVGDEVKITVEAELIQQAPVA